jgi:hypothetical protein
VRWPDLADDLTDPVRYSRRIEEQLRRLHAALGQRPAVAPLIVDDVLAWAAGEDYDPAGGDARSTDAAELHRGPRDLMAARSKRPVLVQIGTQVAGKRDGPAARDAPTRDLPLPSRSLVQPVVRADRR